MESPDSPGCGLGGWWHPQSHSSLHLSPYCVPSISLGAADTVVQKDRGSGEKGKSYVR